MSNEQTSKYLTPDWKPENVVALFWFLGCAILGVSIERRYAINEPPITHHQTPSTFLMRIRIVAVGHLKEPGFVLAQAEYVKRLGRYVRLEVIEVDDDPVPSGERQRQTVKLREGERLLRRLQAPASAGRDCQMVALDARGEQFTSEGLAAWLGGQEASGELTCVLGGTLGLSPEILARTGLRLSLSSLTFPHQLARVVLLEQLYRAFRIQRHEPYHY